MLLPTVHRYAVWLMIVPGIYIFHTAIHATPRYGVIDNCFAPHRGATWVATFVIKVKPPRSGGSWNVE